jgi:hypothetical protein
VTGDQWLEEETQHVLRFLESPGARCARGRGAQMPLIRTLPEMKAWEAHYGPIPWKGAWNAPSRARPITPTIQLWSLPCPRARPPTKPIAEDAVHAMIAQIRAHPDRSR